ncbi:MAG: cytidine deaminase [Acetatifactor sp.]
MDNLPIKELIQTALDARKNAYAPYSHYQVGAALLSSDGTIYSGCNIENASYGATNCAERTAFFSAVSEGKRDFLAIAITGGLEGEEISDYAVPCGICRQIMQEFCGDDFQVIVAKSTEDFRQYPFSEILPFGFDGDKIR